MWKTVLMRNRRGKSGRSIWLRGRALLAVLVVAGLAACGDDSAETAAEAEPQFEGLSPEEMQRQAESMTPEQAESLCIMDTTITVGAPIGADSVVQPGVITAPPADSAPGPGQ